MKKIFFLLTLLSVMIFLTTVTFAEDIGNGKKIIYIPLDNRPVNLVQTIEVAERLGYEILVPPEIFLGSGAKPEQFGNPEELWNWLYENAPQANAAVISTDAMLYGSLVGSRQHMLTAEEVLNRAQNFEKLRSENPNLPLYAFATIMRTPSVGMVANTDAKSYTYYYKQIFNYTVLTDKAETDKLTNAEQKELEQLKKEIPSYALEDWLGRRAKNYNANKYFVDLTKKGVFQYFLAGGDDGARYSQTHLESRHLTEYAAPLGKELFQVMSGADELGMLMISRAINNDLHQVPSIAIGYNDGKGGETFPTFSNEKISESLEGAILSIGGIRVTNPANADLVLAVNTLPNGKTKGAGNKKNTTKPHSGIGSYMKMLKGYLKNNYPVGVVDISHSNGSDNALMKRLKNENLQFKIRSYSGWNTATNSAGFLIGAGVLTNYMNDEDIYSLLMTRYLDDWAYQANIRTQINDGGLIWTVPGEGHAWGLGTRQEGLEKLASDLVADFAKKNIRLPRGYVLKNIQVNFPWSRTFEAEVNFDLDEN